MNENTSPWTIRQKCTADWEKMHGNDKRRFCERCQRHVYNVSAMSREEREVFESPVGMKECIFYSQRRNGEVADLSLLAKLRRWFPIFRFACWPALIAILPVTLTGCMGVRAPKEGQVTPIPQNTQPNSQQNTNQTSAIEAPH
ncbi:MAG TPA: hypothetical protein VNV43_08810 [Candidatus Acidoferrales bacterium]|jgi:hypothetical protein|nr:hypothetical protein [Candidatus Acidoferrales bacterium]